ncbi:hydratase [Oscillospiraceae bacterium MB08-C2-2]|nr:hydratase [Oscillospiraceae bacterium MB08-C2-2]
MIKLSSGGAYLLPDGQLIAETDREHLEDVLAESKLSKEQAAENTMAYGILEAHNTSGNMNVLKIKFDSMASHDITYVGIVQTARASGLTRFPIPYVLTNCHNSLCAVGGTINEDDHVFGLSAAEKYGGIFVPAHQAVIHQYMREMMSGGGRMILGSDSHTRYGALGTMAIGEGGPELVKQLLGKTYDIDRPEVVAIYLTGSPAPGVGPQDVALAIIGAVFKNGYVKNKVMEFVGPGIAGLSADFRIGIDVMTTETTCLSSIWATDSVIQDYFAIHGRPDAYKEISPKGVAYYDGAVTVDLSAVRPMIAMPFHPSNVYTIEELNANMKDILHKVEVEGQEQLGKTASPFSLQDKVRDGGLYVDQAVIAGCSGGTFENVCDAADILKGASLGTGSFWLSVYPSSQPVFLELVKNGAIANLMTMGASVRSAFCGPCFGAGDVPANGGLSIRHTTRNFPSREGSKPGNGQIASVALMDARSIAATALNGGRLTPATALEVEYTRPDYHFDASVYENRCYNGWNKPQPEKDLKFGPNIADWPAMEPLAENLILRVASLITDPVTTTDELIPSGETSSYRSNPFKLAEFTLSRKDPEYVGRAKVTQELQKARLAGENPTALDAELATAVEQIGAVDWTDTGIGSVVFANKPGDGSAREQAASCQKVLGTFANIAHEYATKRYRSNLINWGMLPFLLKEEPVFEVGSYLYLPGIRQAVADKAPSMPAYVLSPSSKQEISLSLASLTDDERQIILSGCLINFYRDNQD